MKTVRGLSRKEFDRKFGTNEQCLIYLTTKKWGDSYVCTRCGKNDYVKGKKQFNRRCSNCGYEESPIANTLFHNIKFDIYKAFGMVYEMMTNKKGASSMRLGELFEISQNTAWLFRCKIQSYLKSSGEHLLTGLVHVDEFEVGTPKKGKQGRAKTDEKARAIIAVEIRKNKHRKNKSVIGNAYVKVIKDFSEESLRPIFNEHIDKLAEIVTDKWSSYQPIAKDYPNMKQVLSNNGANFPEIHVQIRNFKNWLRGTHSFCDWNKLQHYINEYIYRLNRRNHRGSMVDKLFDRFLNEKAPNYKSLTALTT
ncbi:MAG: IS1595 family transposase [Brumimicrobium sp.]|nr:IS1595 family transposase [Brumimicrobium sp.]